MQTPWIIANLTRIATALGLKEFRSDSEARLVAETKDILSNGGEVEAQA